MSRWIRVQTNVFDHELFTAEPLSQREAWLWLIANAAWKETRHRVGNDVLTVPVGSMFYTLRGLQLAWRWGSDKRVRTFLSMLEREGMIGTKTDAGKTHISICNYSRYQDAGRTEDASGTHGGRSEDALKTPVHQDTNSSLRSSSTKRGTRLADDWKLPAAWGKWALDQGHSEAVIRIEAEKFLNHWTSKTGKDAAKLDWEKTWRNWMLNVPKGRSDRPSQQAPPRQKSDFMQHQDDVQRELDKALGRNPNDEFTGKSFDLDQRDWRPH